MLDGWPQQAIEIELLMMERRHYAFQQLLPGPGTWHSMDYGARR